MPVSRQVDPTLEHPCSTPASLAILRSPITSGGNNKKWWSELQSQLSESSASSSSSDTGSPFKAQSGRRIPATTLLPFPSPTVTATASASAIGPVLPSPVCTPTRSPVQQTTVGTPDGTASALPASMRRCRSATGRGLPRSQAAVSRDTAPLEACAASTAPAVEQGRLLALIRSLSARSLAIGGRHCTAMTNADTARQLLTVPSAMRVRVVAPGSVLRTAAAPSAWLPK